MPMTRERDDAVPHMGRWIVPTASDTVWVDTWEQFKEVGGVACFEEDQTTITLSLPVGHKFSIRFQRND